MAKYLRPQLKRRNNLFLLELGSSVCHGREGLGEKSSSQHDNQKWGAGAEGEVKGGDRDTELETGRR